MLKRKVWIKRKDGIKQRYWVGRNTKRNYGSKMFKEQIKKELFSGTKNYINNLSLLKDIERNDPRISGSKFIENPQIGQKLLIRTIEKHPYLLKDLKGKDVFFYEPKDDKTSLGFVKGDSNLIGINTKMLDTKHIHLLTDPLTKSTRDFTFQDVLKHEIAHIKQQKLAPNINIELAEIASDYAVHTDIRKEKPRKQLMDKSISKYFSREVLI